MGKSGFISIPVLLAAAAVTLAACSPAEPFRNKAGDGGGIPFGSGGGGAGGSFIDGSGGVGGGGGVDDGGVDTQVADVGGNGGSDAPPDTSFDAPQLPDRPDVRDASSIEMLVMPLLYTNHCARVHWTASASVAAASDPSSDAVDGRSATRWATGRPQSGNEYFQVDFGGPVRVNQIVLDNRAGMPGDYPRGYRVLTSNDGNTFAPVLGPVPQANPGPVTTITLPWTPGRYIRIGQTGSDGVAWWSINEIRFNCQLLTAPSPEAVDPFDPAGWKATASASLGGAGESNAFDDNLMSRWTTGTQQRGTEWFLLDLGAAATVSQVILEASGADVPERFSLELSTDNLSFAPVASGAGSQLTRILFNARSARYLRIKQTGTATNPWSIAEITIKP